MNLFVLSVTAILIFIIFPILFVLVYKKEKQIRDRNERNRKWQIEQQQQIFFENKNKLQIELDKKKQEEIKETIKNNLYKIFSLYKAGVYSEEEYYARKKDIIDSSKKIKLGNEEEFLLELIVLKEKDILNKDDLMFIKELMKK